MRVSPLLSILKALPVLVARAGDELPAQCAPSLKMASLVDAANPYHEAACIELHEKFALTGLVTVNSVVCVDGLVTKVEIAASDIEPVEF